MVKFKINSIKISSSLQSLEDKDIYYILKWKDIYVAKVHPINSTLSYFDTPGIEIKLSSNQDLYMQIWQYEPNKKLSFYTINQQKLNKQETIFIKSNKWIITLLIEHKNRQSAKSKKGSINGSNRFNSSDKSILKHLKKTINNLTSNQQKDKQQKKQQKNNSNSQYGINAKGGNSYSGHLIPSFDSDYGISPNKFPISFDLGYKQNRSLLNYQDYGLMKFETKPSKKKIKVKMFK